MSYECNEGFEHAIVLVEVARKMLATTWKPLEYAQQRDQDHLIGRLEDAIQGIQEALISTKREQQQ